MADINAIAEQIQGLTLLEAAQLVKVLEEKLGVSAASAAVSAAPAAGGAAASTAPAVEEKTEFSVILQSAGSANKVQVIKLVREFTTLGLKEAKDLVDGAPKPIKEGVNKDEAESIRKKFADAGATVEVK